MQLIFICAYAVAVYADIYAHIRMKPHRKIRIVYADMRISANMRIIAYMWINSICSYEKSTQVCYPIRLTIMKTSILQILSVHLFEVMISADASHIL